MSDAADRRIAELEREIAQLRSGNISMQAHERQLLELQRRDLTRIKELEAKLVERDVYEAQQILPPEQAALIKHLATVERCIEEGTTVGYTEDPQCVFCNEYDAHTKDCAWLALQFDRKPAETMAMVEGWAWEENARSTAWVRFAGAMTPARPGRLANMQNVLRDLWPIERVQDVVYDPAPLYNHLVELQAEPPPATVTPDEAPQHPGLEGEPRRARGGEVDQEGVPPVDHRPPDGQR